MAAHAAARSMALEAHTQRGRIRANAKSRPGPMERNRQCDLARRDHEATAAPYPACRTECIRAQRRGARRGPAGCNTALFDRPGHQCAEPSPALKSGAAADLLLDRVHCCDAVDRFRREPQRMRDVDLVGLLACIAPSMPLRGSCRCRGDDGTRPDVRKSGRPHPPVQLRLHLARQPPSPEILNDAVPLPKRTDLRRRKSQTAKWTRGPRSPIPEFVPMITIVRLTGTARAGETLR